MIAILNSEPNRGLSDPPTDTSVLFMEGQGRGLNRCTCWTSAQDKNEDGNTTNTESLGMGRSSYSGGQGQFCGWLGAVMWVGRKSGASFYSINTPSQ